MEPLTPPNAGLSPELATARASASPFGASRLLTPRRPEAPSARQACTATLSPGISHATTDAGTIGG
jgi:hypothetical protein